MYVCVSEGHGVNTFFFVHWSVGIFYNKNTEKTIDY